MEQSSIETNLPFLSLRHVEKVYPNGEKAVYDFNLDVNKKDFIVIVGPSGCGKSTTLRMIAGLEDVTSGDIFLENELLNYKPSKDRKMAIVFQSYALYPQMNVFDNIAFPLTINKYPNPVTDKKLYPLAEAKHVVAERGYDAVLKALDGAKNTLRKNERAEKIADALSVSPETAQMLADYYRADEENGNEPRDEILQKRNATVQALLEEGAKRLDEEGIKYNEKFELLDDNGEVRIENRAFTPYEIKTKVYDTARILDLVPYLDKLPKELSGGQMQRVALGRAIIKNVPIFMMDEPLSNLDAKLRLTMRSEIVKLHNKINATTIYVTHDQTEAMTMATRIVVMSRGFVQQIGAPKEIYNAPRNIFVAKFIGSPSMNIFEGRYDRGTGLFSFGGLSVSLGEEFGKRHDGFYAEKERELAEMLESFDLAAREKMLKMLSVTGENRDLRSNKTKRKGLIAGIKAKFAKKVDAEEFAAEKKICEEKLARIREYLNSNHPLTVGIRPERVAISMQKNGAAEGSFMAKPTFCELLGGEYNVHFDFCGKDMVVKTDARSPITTDNDFTVSFAREDMYFFDPVTGEVV